MRYKENVGTNSFSDYFGGVGVRTADSIERSSKSHTDYACSGPDGSVSNLTGTDLFLTYVNDLPCSVSADCTCVCRCTTFLVKGQMEEIHIKAKSLLKSANEWFKCNRLKLNNQKTQMFAS